MKYLFSICNFLLVSLVFAQKPCEFSTNVVDSIGSYRSTKEYLLFEKNFGGSSTYIFGSLILTDEKAMFNVQLIEKSGAFIKAKCFDKNSKVYVQLISNKIVTLSLVNEESCGTLLRDDKGLNNRILTACFSISKLDFAELKQSPISFIRLKFATDVNDYVLKKEFISELNGETYQPESYFMNYLHCFEAQN
jgi:hypothetical protein